MKRMFNIESYISPILLSYVDKYVRDFKPADAQVSLWGGGVTLHNLVLKADVLQQEVSLPFTLVSGRIHELLIQVPWTKIMSEPIIVTINTIECVLSLNPPPEETPPQETQSGRSQVVEAPPGYMQALIRRIVSNIAVRVNSLIVKYVQDDIVLSLNVKKLAIDSVGVNWEPAFADIDQSLPVIRRLVRLDDLTLCLDKTDSDGKIRFFHEPLLYRCQLDLRVLTRLVSANTRRAQSLSVQLLSSQLAWGVNSEQLVLLLRLLRERTLVETKQPPPAPKQSNVQAAPLHVTASTSAEPARTESWSEWAWSWLPAWDREDVDESPIPATPIPIAFTAHFDKVSLVFKILETEGTTRKRARSILELTASDAVVKSFICFPTLLRVNFGARGITISSHGRCVCGHLDANAVQGEPAIYLNKIESIDEEPWSWVDEELTEQSIERAVAVNEDAQFDELVDEPQELPERIFSINRFAAQVQEELDEFWFKMAPVIYFEYSHERAPPTEYINPYDNPPRNFQYSDWVEESSLKITIRPLLINVSTGLLHRIAVVRKAFEEVPAVEEIELPMRTLTVEECDALSENLPVRHTSIDVEGLRVRFIPSAHSIIERSMRVPLILDVQLPSASVMISAPLYPHRVCSAACQILDDSGPLFHGSRLHITFESTIEVGVSSPDEDVPRACTRTDIRIVTHSLLNRSYFKGPETVLFGYTARIREANVCGSAARLQAAYHVAQSLINEKLADPLRNTTLAKDALNDEEHVAVDITLEELLMRRFATSNVNTQFVSINSIKATAFHSPGGELKQSWIFSGPDSPTVTPYLEGSFQWCNEPSAKDSIEFIKLCVQPTALSLDPLLVSWLSYRPKQIPIAESVPQIPSIKTMSSTQYLSRRRATPPSSSGRGVSRSGSGAELVHMRPRSLESSSERSEKKEPKHPPQKKPETQTWSSPYLIQLYERLNRLLIIAEVGLVQLYVASTTVSALDCATVRDAMERHATTENNVLVVSLGRILMESNPQLAYLWVGVKYDRPTHQRPKRDPPAPANEESFPWQISVSDMSCYTLEVRVGSERSGKERSASGLKSQLKASRVVLPRQLLELVTTTIMVSVVTKSLKIHVRSSKKSEQKKREHTRDNAEDKTKYFTMGTDFKPSSLKEFIRGPARRKKASPEPQKPEPAPEPASTKAKYKIGPVISLGVNLYADTPPIIFRLDQDQVQTVANAMHCFAHVMTLLRRQPATPKQGSTSLGDSQKSVIRSASELDARQSISEETASENRSEPLISIYEPHKPPEIYTEMKTFFWFQWVVSRATLVVVTPRVKLAFEVDDVITTADLQEHYNQLKTKVASASVRHYKRTGDDEWTAGVLGGRILEVREPTNAKEENYFLSVTVTQAQISNLPVSWKDELHPKLLESNSSADSMWEVYATLAPLEAVLQPDILEHLMTWLHEMTPQSLCPLNTEEIKSGDWMWPFLYVTAGGLRLLLTTGENEILENTCDDTLMLVIGKVTVSPHPENPICRQSVNPGTDSSWTPLSPGLDGRQYEVLVRHLAIRSAQLNQLVNQEVTESEMLKGTGSENPALKWSQPVVSPVITPILHSVDVGCILAPAIYSEGAIISGPAVELNLLSDCSVEMGVESIELVQTLVQKVLHVFRQRSESSLTLEEGNICPYAANISNRETTENANIESEPTTETQETPKSSVEPNRSYIFDSGVETTTSQSTYKNHRESVPIKKSVSIVGADHTAKPSDYLEVYVTMGVIDFSLYAKDDDSREVRALRPPPGQYTAPSEPKIKVPIFRQRFNRHDHGETIVVVIDESKETKSEEGKDSIAASRSLTETIRNVDIGKTKLELMHILPLARKAEGNVPLLHATLHQPNLYYLNRKKQKTIQISLFNAWIGLGVGPGEGHWNAPLLTTTRGSPDPVTDIPPALATLRVDLSPGGFPSFTSASGRGNVQLDVERPVMFEVSADSLQRLKGIIALVEKNVVMTNAPVKQSVEPPVPLLYKIRQNMVGYEIESVIVHTGQIGVRGSEGAVGCDGVRLQLAIGERPQRLTCRVLLTAAIVTSGPDSDRRHVVLQPLMAGAVIDATWEAWKRAEGGPSACEPTLRIGIDLDRIILDLRPSDLATVARIYDNANEIFGFAESQVSFEPTVSQESLKSPSSDTCNMPTNQSTYANQQSTSESDHTNHFYKDDLRSGAFKIVVGCQLPMAYQVTLHGSTVSWRYPHPRAITRLIAYPMPNLEDEQVECVLELYFSMLGRWEPHTYFKLPVSEPREMVLSSSPTDAVFAVMWRVRVCHETETQTPFVFNASKFMPRQDPLSPDQAPAGSHKKLIVSAEQLSGILRVDSYFAPRFLPRARVALRIVAVDIHAHNDLPRIPKQSSILEGYYVSRPLMRSHRMLTLSACDTSIHCVFAASSTLLFDTCLSSDIIDCGTGTMEPFIEEFRIQGTITLCKEPRLRLRVGEVRTTLLVARMSTLRALIDDWSAVYEKCIKKTPESKVDIDSESKKDAATILSGRVSLWIHNGCSSALRVGQEATDELIPLSAGLSLAYRWRSPGSPKKLRFSIVTPSMDWRWSTSVRFAAGTYRVRLDDTESSRNGKGGLFLYIRVKDSGSRRDMYLSGRLMLANTLRHNLLYKVRARCSDMNVWQTISSEELHAESVGLSVLCSLECEVVLKVKFPSHESGWSGDIPLKECRKENVPWLVKVPSEGEVSYTSVWCRVIRARSDGRIVATIWPFYVLRSHLPLDVDVLITSETVSPTDEASGNPPPIVQTASGRGTTTQIIAPGTTSARHTLTFQYRNIECPVTREAVPLHYGMTETSVFDKPTPVANIEDAIDMIQQWLQKSSRDAKSNWPYSIVTNHLPGEWQPALLQPRCDVTIRYEAVRAGGGCSLELQLSPVALLANASPITLTLRAYDAAPLCRIEPGVAISPPSIVLQKPFFMSVEIGRETFVSGQLQLCKEEQGRYGQPPPGYIALEKAANFAVQCNQKVALLTMYYEIKEEINVLGVTSTYMLINRLRTDILVSAIASPKEMDNSTLRPKTFKIVEPTMEGSLQGTPLCRFWMNGRWRGGDVDELRAFLCLALPTTVYQANSSVPVRLGMAPVRRAIALKNDNGQSVPIVVTQVKHEARWLITIAEDPCPQFLVHNRTKTTLAVAQPVKDDDNTGSVKTVQDCLDARWWCVVESNGVTHYSTPSHCSRYPPPPQSDLRNPLPYLTVGHCRGEGSYEWCHPIAIADGEQLLQLTGDVTIKLRVRTYPHSTLIELQDVDQNDISASDIRRRLLGAFEEDTSQQNKEPRSVEDEYRRLSADSKRTGSLSGVSVAEDVGLAATRFPNNPSTSQQVQSQQVTMTSTTNKTDDSSLLKLSGTARDDITQAYKNEIYSATTVARKDSTDLSESSYLLDAVSEKDWSDGNEVWPEKERFRCLVSSIVATVGASSDELPLLALHMQRVSVLVQTDARKTKTTLSVADVQIDNVQYETEQYDFAVVATTRAEVTTVDRWPALWGMFNEKLPTHASKARLYLRTCHDRWTAANREYQELTELELRLGPLGLYVEDAYVASALELIHLAAPPTAQTSESTAITEINTLQNPLRLRKLLFHPLDLTLTLHTAVRMYIALDESPLRLSAFQLQDVMTSSERLTHALTVHYLSAAILGAGWVVGGLELLGAPGALAARVGSAGGGVRGVASAAAGALLRSLSSAAGSLARNLDLLAGDDEHAKRAAAARRRPPPNLMAGLVAGITNFAINLLGAVGGLAHHPLVGVAVGESESGAAALRRGLVGAITKPLSATADLVAYAGHGLLTQTGWDPVPQPKAGTVRSLEEISIPSGWRRDCVRWSFRFAELGVLTGFEAELDGTPLQLLFTHKYLVMIDAETEKIYEMIDFKFCTIGPYQTHVIELYVKQKRSPRLSESRVVVDEDNEVQISAAAMARVARYTGAEGYDTNETRLLTLLPPPSTANALRAALCAVLHANVDTHFTLL